MHRSRTWALPQWCLGRRARGTVAARSPGLWAGQREIAEAAGTSEVTLRNRLRDLEKLFGESDQIDIDKDLEIIPINS